MFRSILRAKPKEDETMPRSRMLGSAVVLVILVSITLVPRPMSASDSAEAVPPSETIRRDHPVRLLSSTPAGVKFELDVPWQDLRVEPATVGGRAYVRVSLPGWSIIAQPGAPELPFLTETVGVPYGAKVSVRVEPGPVHTLVLPAPVAPVATQEFAYEPVAAFEGLPSLPAPSLTVAEDPAVYGGATAYPGILAQVANEGVVRQQHVAGIATYPVQYHPGTRRLTVYETLRVELTFEDSTPEEAFHRPMEAPAESAIYEALARETLLNYETARAWRQALTPAPSTALAKGLVVRTSANPTNAWAPPVPGWRIKVRENGFYRLTYSDLQATGLPVGTLDPRTFQVYYLGTEAAIEVAGEADGRFDPADSLVFYGQAITNKYTRDNVYWLTYGKATGLRMAARDGAPGMGETPAFYAARLHVEQNKFYIPKAPGEENLERWLWDYVYSPSRPTWNQAVSLAAPYTGSGTARLKVAMLGYLQNPIYPDHHTRLYLNGTLVEDTTWDGITWHVSDIAVPQSLLKAGNNTISVVCPNDTGVGYDVIYIDSVDLDYSNTFLAESDALSFTYETAGSWKYLVDGFTTDQVAIYDVTNPSAAVRLTGIAVTSTPSGYAAQFQDSIAAPTGYWAMAGTAYRTVQAIEADSPSDLRNTETGADYLLVTHHTFAGAVAALRDFRASQGLRAVQVDVQDVYDEFGYGITGAVAIHDFLAYAYGNWKAPAPSYVVLIGDGNYDPKNYLGYGRTSYMPPYLAPVDPGIGETAADNRYVTVVGEDTFPDLMLGRLSVNSSAEASALVAKIVAYEQGPAPGDWNQQVLAVADNADGAGDFARMSEQLLSAYLPTPYQAQTVYYGVTHTTLAAARAAILDGINAGKLIVNYIGHADPTRWAYEDLLTTTDVPLLQNGGKLPVMLSMTCYDGYYHYPYPIADGMEALGEVVTRADRIGAVASWSPTGVGVATGHDNLDQGFFQSMFLDGLRGLGEATIAGKLKLWATGRNLDLLDTYLLFGDPATKLRLPPIWRAVYLPSIVAASDEPATPSGDISCRDAMDSSTAAAFPSKWLSSLLCRTAPASFTAQ
jgi:hypothetical protein